MLCRGSGKQKPHVHGGKLWEGGAEGKNTSMLPGLRGQGAAAANRAGPLHPWVPKVWSAAGSAGICNAGLTAQPEPQLERSTALSLLCSGVGQPGDSQPGAAAGWGRALEQTEICSLLKPLLLFSMQPLLLSRNSLVLQGALISR